MKKDSRIYVAGSTGLVGSALCQALEAAAYTDVLGATHDQFDLMNLDETWELFRSYRPEYVFLAAAKVAGIEGNMKQPVQMMEQNLRIQNNVIAVAHEHKVKKLMFFGSSCIYPRLCPQPIKEEYLLTSPLEPSNEPYALAKIAGLKLCQAYRRQYGDNFISVMPTNLYGVNDTYRPGCHVIPDLIRKFHEAKNLDRHATVWGDGSIRREFLCSDDLAQACLLIMEKYDGPEPINIGYGSDVTIKELAHAIAKVVGLQGQIVFEPSGPTGTPIKLLDSSKIFSLGWKPKIDLATGLKLAYDDFLKRIIHA
jgi:GDP-L-fucose synthase